MGIKSFANSVEGELLSKLFFLFFVWFGLFMAGLNYWFGLNKNFWLGVVLVGLGFVTLIDWRKLLKQYRLIGRSKSLFVEGGII